jgi:hypothetical protein
MRVLDGQPDGLTVQPSSVRSAADPLRGRGTGSANTTVDTRPACGGHRGRGRTPGRTVRCRVRTGRMQHCRTPSSQGEYKSPGVRSHGHADTRADPTDADRPGRPYSGHPAASLHPWLDIRSDTYGHGSGPRQSRDSSLFVR